MVLQELIFHSFHSQFLLWDFSGCGGLERTNFKQFLYWAGVVVLKELVHSFYFGKVWWS